LRREVESLLIEPAGGEFLDRPAIRNAPHLLEDSTLGLASRVLDRTVSKASSARAAWARSFGPSTRD
jgi:hypothetical protein